MRGRTAVRALAAVGAGLALLYISWPPARPAEPEPLVRAVEGPVLPVAEIERSVDFYTRVLFFEKVSDEALPNAEGPCPQGIDAGATRVVGLRLGSDRIALTRCPGWIAGRPSGRRGDPLLPAGHVAIAVSDIAQVRLWLDRHRVPSQWTLPRPEVAGRSSGAGTRMLALRDPDGHRIRILESGSDEGDPRWDRASAVFLGIDHVALPVGTSGRSLAFYRDTLGLTVVEPREIRDRLAGDSLSKASASSRTTTLRAAAGPAIHLQEPFASANDPVSGRTGVGHHRWWLAARAGRAEAGPRATTSRLAAPTPAEAFATGAPDSRFTRVLSDPDGHLVLLRPR